MVFMRVNFGWSSEKLVSGALRLANGVVGVPSYPRALAAARCRNGPGPSLWRRMVAVPRMMTKWGSG
jgi:hypothetical protein